MKYKQYNNSKITNKVTSGLRAAGRELQLHRPVYELDIIVIKDEIDIQWRRV